MPELPEVEVTRLGLLPHLPGRRITALFCSGRRLRQPIPITLLEKQICGSTVISLDRQAKYLLIRMDNASVLVVHLGMTGKLGIFPQAAARKTHDHLCLRLDSGLELRFNDARRFGSIMVWPKEKAVQLEEEFSRSQGIEPFGPDFTAENLAHLADGRRQAVKIFLMNAKLIAGMGNIYANEALFAAGMSPMRAAGQITLNEYDRLAAAIQAILAEAIRQGGTTVRDFVGSDGQPGYFQQTLQVYGRHGLPCVVCGETIQRSRIGQRATYCCPHCQPC